MTLTACGAARRELTVGAVDDAAKWSPNARRPMQLAANAGLKAIVLSAVWKQGASASGDLPPLRRAVRAAKAEGIEPQLAVYQFSSSTPLDDASRTAFSEYAVALVRALPAVRTVFVGNEPNLNLFWMPQFDSGGGDAAAAAYEELLAATYDALKSADPKLTVVGGNLAPRGGDDPSASRQTHSPTSFIKDLGNAYRASGRTKPLMDMFSIHVYGESPKIPPSFRHPQSTSIGIADYDKLVLLLGQAFDGTAQPGSKMPIVYGEYGVETDVPSSGYTGTEVVPTADVETQSRDYRQAIELAACQKTVRALDFFHVIDERKLAGLQSGLYYVDGTAKPSVDSVRAAAEHARCRS
ncbi:MAG TPA: hypothetical protein VLJ44_10530 [Gaiellaceae bacterium]|nr:hypothetical protein [Gaiellaceae bacterium]